MKETLPPGGWKGTISLISYGSVCVINADYRNGDRISTSALELCNLIAEIVDYAIDLFDHRFRQNLDLDANFNRGYRPSGYEIAPIRYRSLARDDFSEGAVAPTSVNASALILDVTDAVFACSDGLNQLSRSIHGDEVLEKMHRYEVALTGIAMFVGFAFKQTPEFRQ